MSIYKSLWRTSFSTRISSRSIFRSILRWWWKSTWSLRRKFIVSVAELVYMPFCDILSNQNFVVTRTTLLYYFPAVHFPFPEYTRAHTGSSILKVRTLSCLFPSPASFDTALSGHSKLSLVVISLLNIIEAGVFPVIECGEERYFSKNWHTATCKLFSLASILDLNVWTKRSASRVIWCWQLVMNSVNCLNVSEVNWVPLSDTMTCEIPYLANNDRKTSMVRSLDVLNYLRPFC